MKRELLLLTALTTTGTLQVQADPFVITSGETITENQDLHDGEDAQIEAGGALNVNSNDEAISLHSGTTRINNAGVIANSGSDRGIRAHHDNADVTITNQSTGIIRTAQDDAIQINADNAATHIINHGVIEAGTQGVGGDNGQAIDLNHINDGSDNYIYNDGTITSRSADTIRPGVNGIIENRGLIRAFDDPGEHSDGIDTQENSGVTIHNQSTGRIISARHGITGGTENPDDIYRLTVTNDQQALIIGEDGSGINIDGFNANEVVTINNAGTITGQGLTHDGDGVDVDGIVQLTNSGTIQGIDALNDVSEGITVGGGTITNTGTIRGTNSLSGGARGITLAGLDHDADDTPYNPPQSIYADTTVINSGTISGDDTAVGTTGGVSNHSLIIINDGLLEGHGSDINDIHHATLFTEHQTVQLINRGHIYAEAGEAAVNLGDSDSSIISVQGADASIQGDIIATRSTHSTLEIIPGSNNVFTYTDTIDGISSLNIGAGTTILNGSTTAETTTISAGTLVIGSTEEHRDANLTGNVHIASDGTLRGHGIIVGNITNDGLFYPGYSADIVTVTGDYVQDADGVLEFDVDEDSYSGLDVSGDVTLDGSLVINNNAQIAAGDSYNFITAGGTVSGTFARIVSNSVFLDPDLTYNSSDVNLAFVRNSNAFSSFAHTRNQRRAARAAETLDPSSDIYTALTRLSATDAPDAFDQLGGQIYADTSLQLLTDNQQLHTRLLTQARHALDYPNGHFWVTPWADTRNTKHNHHAASANHHARGLTLGRDWLINNTTRAGISLDQGNSNNKTGISGRHSTSVNSTTVAAYIDTQTDPLNLSAGVDLGYNRIKGQRHLSLPVYHRQFGDNYHARTLGGFIGLQNHAIQQQNFTAVPYGQLSYTYADIDSINETGEGAALHLQGQHHAQLMSELGVDLEHPLEDSGIITTRIGWQHVWNGDELYNQQQFASGNRYRIQSQQINDDMIVARIGLSSRPFENADISINLDTRYGSQDRDRNLNASFNYAF